MPWELLTLGLLPASWNHIVLLACIVIAALWIRTLHLQATAKIPGPWHLKLSSLFVKHRELLGQKREWVHKLHLRYGPVVQVACNEVSFASYTAAKQIYGSGSRDFPKTELYSLFQQDGHM